MPNWKKVIVSGSNAVLNQVSASGHMSVLSNGFTVNTHTSTELEVVGDISASGHISASFFVGDGSQLTGITVNATNINHDLLNNFVENEHINHTDVTLTAGDGLTGGGDISEGRSFAVDPHTGVTVDTNGVSIGQDVATTANVEFNSVEATYRKLDMSTTTVLNYNGDVVFFGDNGSNFTQQRVHHYDGANWDRADDNSLASATGLLAIAIGANASDGMLIRGFFTLGSSYGTAGDPLYLGNNGDFNNTPPDGSGQYSKVLGTILHNNGGQIYFNPSPDWIEIE